MHKSSIVGRGQIDKIIFNFLSYTIVGIFALACILPFYLVVIGSFSDERTIITEGYSLVIKKFSLEAYKLIFKNPISIIRAYEITIFVTVVGTICNLFITLMTAYVLARKDFPWRNGIMFFFFFTTLFNGGLVPWYLLCSEVLKFNDKIYALILPLMFSVWNMIIATNYIRNNIPFEIIESAKIDGAGDFTMFIKLIVPLCKPLTATLALFTALAYWNDWYNCMLFIRNENMYTLQYYLQELLNSAEAIRRIAEKSGRIVQALPMESTKMAMTVIATGPIILLYPFLQKYFIKGITIGALKG
ncbi:carbohydrate ABC transporter permease [Anaerocellum diazotrophicum]|uniref:Sugar ABC transporter permease n=1 Tax=Caldicellulosiruptor diazotrophicus TaxID=2806205 RepID=A0ABN6E961_9FIRM|nr:carbohydrate ABC transporter permease [Caldicellulosiruptor diazotrophicus]BCS82087.1 sugar ABC transporter permease [Caldicellulosiruptor diazotrophicus]